MTGPVSPLSGLFSSMPHVVLSPFRLTTGSRWSVRRRPGGLPPFWRNITGPLGLADYMQRRDWRLVLSACRIPHILNTFRKREYIYVPPLLEKVALHELTDFDAERRRGALPQPPWPVYPYGGLTAFFLLPLLLWHGLRMGWWPAPDFLPPPQTWSAAGILDNVLVRVYGQFYRLATALTLHGDLRHLWGNIAFGALFLTLLARLAGLGRAVWLTLVGGILGNGLTVLFRPRAVASLGFSTALFAAVGILAGMMAGRQAQRRKAILPIAASAALLAMLGTEGENTDYAAHVAGLLCGLALGLGESWRLRRAWPALPQIPAGFLALAVPALAWWWAFAAL